MTPVCTAIAAPITRFLRGQQLRTSRPSPTERRRGLPDRPLDVIDLPTLGSLLRKVSGRDCRPDVRLTRAVRESADGICEVDSISVAAVCCLASEIVDGETPFGTVRRARVRLRHLFPLGNFGRYLPEKALSC